MFRVDSLAAYAYSKNATTCLFASHLGYAYGVGDKSTACSSVRSHFIGYFDAVKYIFIECDKLIRH